MGYERTLGAATTTSGIGLHSGTKAALRLLPAAAGSGIQFRRVDLDGFVVEARSANIARVSYATSLMKKGVFISTTEHLLSALVGAGIDNVVAEIDNLEVPILDGSALPFMTMIDGAEVKRQGRTRRVVKIVKKVEMREGEKFIGVYPAGSYRLHYAIDFPHPMIGRQEFSMELTPEAYRREVAPARTFGFLQDFAAMRRQGLIRGGSLENAVVLDERRVVNGELRYGDEFVRHKMLDLIGDLALLGAPLQAEVVADRAGHALHTALVKKLLADHSLWEFTEVEERHEAPPQAAGYATIMSEKTTTL
ncbi:MAG TPA: UDP-3-O-acyl-N-acetylglucosamine deacetylase [Terriglobales bacterium]|nr:UDP-3-O-acyl-N-acetylglucosamine deacetylase [Terriglobales bacterium]